MRIQHNIAAINTHRSMNFTNKGLSNTLEKLSSGYRINRAGDDAAGLAISEKMRGQIRGLNMAQKNTQDAISLVQTAEGAMTEIHAMLQRGRELSVQAANDTNTTFDREQLQKEISQINEEIDHLANRTEFNTKKLLTSEKPTLGNLEELSGIGSIIDPKIRKLTEDLVGYMIKTTEKAVTDAYGITSRAEYEIEIKYDNGGKGGWVASVWSKFDLGTGKGHPYELNIDKDDFFTDEPLWVSQDRIIAHEMVHAVMSGAGISHTDRPFWFSEGTAELVAGANERVRGDLNALSPGYSFTTASAADQATTIQNLLAVTETATDSPGYSAGYLASKYLMKAINDKNPAHSIQDFMKDLSQVGATFDGVMNTYTNFATNAAFMTDFKGANGQAFVQGLNLFDPAAITQTGSILEGKTINGTTYGSDDLGIIPDTANALDSNTMFKYKWHASTYKEAIDLAGGTPALGASIDAIRTGEVLQFQIGANEGQSFVMETYKVSAANLGIANQKVTSHEEAIVAITSFDRAINVISSARSNLGAIQNRLEHTINNLGTASENLTSAESRIRDTDMAKEMMSFTKNNILMQAAQSMLSQANQQPQGVLQLLG